MQDDLDDVMKSMVTKKPEGKKTLQELADDISLQFEDLDESIGLLATQIGLLAEKLDSTLQGQKRINARLNAAAAKAAPKTAPKPVPKKTVKAVKKPPVKKPVKAVVKVKKRR